MSFMDERFRMLGEEMSVRRAHPAVEDKSWFEARASTLIAVAAVWGHENQVAERLDVMRRLLD